MKSYIKKAIYAGLGFANDGAIAVRNLGRELARKANLSEAEGEKAARALLAKSSRAAKSIRKTLDDDVTKVANAIHELIFEEIETKNSKSAPPVKTSPKRKPKTATASVKLNRSRQ